MVNKGHRAVRVRGPTGPQVTAAEPGACVPVFARNGFTHKFSTFIAPLLFFQQLRPDDVGL